MVPVAPTPDTLLTRSEAARELGTHVSTIRRWERKSVLTRTVGDDGVHRFPRRQLLELVEVRERTTPARRALPADFDDGVTTAAVFELFAEGLAPEEVVIRKKLPAAAVLALHRTWLAMRGAFVVSREVAAQLELLRGAPIVDEGSLLRSVQQSPPNTNSECHEELFGTEALCRPVLETSASSASSSSPPRQPRKEPLDNSKRSSTCGSSTWTVSTTTSCAISTGAALSGATGVVADEPARCASPAVGDVVR